MSNVEMDFWVPWQPCRAWAIRVILASVFAVNAGAMRAVAGRPVLVGKHVEQQQRVSMRVVQHAAWDALLRKYVNQDGLVDYRAWRASKESMEQLDEYLAMLSAVQLHETDTKSEVLAFWINAYNAVTVYGILREYPTSSIRNHTAKFVGYNIWKDLKLQVSDRLVSLDEMEHAILRKLSEPRIHFAIVCASIGCPKLQAWAFEPKQIDTQLSAVARQFFHDPRNFQWDRSGNVTLSQILNWFGSDFGASQQERLSYIARYAPADALKILQSGRVRIRYSDYDWSLNEQNESASQVPR